MGDEYADKVIVYEDAENDWRWRAVAGNNKTVADSSEGYENKSYAISAAAKLFPNSEIVVKDEIQA
jgi:uncharacterized protein YegP (UPF0339 family)